MKWSLILTAFITAFPSLGVLPPNHCMVRYRCGGRQGEIRHVTLRGVNEKHCDVPYIYALLNGFGASPIGHRRNICGSIDNLEPDVLWASSKEDISDLSRWHTGHDIVTDITSYGDNSIWCVCRVDEALAMPRGIGASQAWQQFAGEWRRYHQASPRSEPQHVPPMVLVFQGVPKPSEANADPSKSCPYRRVVEEREKIVKKFIGDPYIGNQRQGVPFEDSATGKRCKVVPKGMFTSHNPTENSLFSSGGYMGDNFNARNQVVAPQRWAPPESISVVGPSPARPQTLGGRQERPGRNPVSAVPRPASH